MKYAELVASNKGKNVDVKGIIFSVVGEIDKKGKLKNGDEVGYVTLTAADNSGEMLDLHPRKAQELFSKGEIEGIKMLVDTEAAAAHFAKMTAAAEAPAAPATTEAAPAEAAPAEPTEPTEAAAPATTEAAGEAEAPKKLSKKEQCVAFFKFGVENGKTRQEILAAFATVGVTGPGAATYYQNCKSGKEGWV